MTKQQLKFTIPTMIPGCILMGNVTENGNNDLKTYNYELNSFENYSKQSETGGFSRLSTQ